MSSPGEFSAVFVCSGNQFRSVIAETVFRAVVDDPRVEVSSFGTLDLAPTPPLPAAVREAAALGHDITGHRARNLSDADLAATSLVLAFELRHAVAAVDVGGAALERVFILPELVLLLDRIGLIRRPDRVEQAFENVAHAQARRHDSLPDRPAAEIEDPVSQPESVQAAIARAVEQAARTLAIQLFGPT